MSRMEPMCKRSYRFPVTAFKNRIARWNHAMVRTVTFTAMTYGLPAPLSLLSMRISYPTTVGRGNVIPLFAFSALLRYSEAQIRFLARINDMIRKKLPAFRLADLPEGKTVSFRYGISNGIAYNDGGVIKAYVNACTHMGGTVVLTPTGPQRSGSGCEGCVFRCVRHHAEFDPKTGARTAGQAPEGSALTPIVLETEGDQVYAILEFKDEFE
jgi:nitrite reductase/ring-hydroxylating ferredoxin subunit